MFIKVARSTLVATMVTWKCVVKDLGLESKLANVLPRYHPFGTQITHYNYRNVNIPWESQGMGDGDYMHAFQQVVMPIAREFNPDLVIGKINLSDVWKMLLTSYSCRWIRRCRRRYTGWLFCDPRLLCSNDAYAHEPC